MKPRIFEREDSRYAVVLTNFGNTVYEGTDLFIATNKAESVGFETTLVKRRNLGKGWEIGYNYYSPIGGWR